MNFMNYLFPLAGFFIGSLVGVSGVGGGSLMTPLLLYFGIPPFIAVGTDLAFATATKIAGATLHRKLGHVDWPIVFSLITGAIPSAIITALIMASHGPVDPYFSSLIKKAIGVTVGITALSLLIKPTITSWMRKYPQWELKGFALCLTTIVIGAVLGVLVCISSIGAGAIGATAISLLYPRLSSAKVAGTDIAYAIPLTFVAACAHWMIGSIDWVLLVLLLTGSIPGVILGTLCSSRIAEHNLRLILCALMILTSINFLM